MALMPKLLYKLQKAQSDNFGPKFDSHLSLHLLISDIYLNKKEMKQRSEHIK